MSFVTFILITGYHFGNTEKIGVVYSKSIFLWILESLIQKGLFICFGFGNPFFLELVAFTGYKFVVLCLVILAQILGGVMASYIVMAIAGLMFCYFFYCTLRRY
jgi:hypothetical protein